LFPGVARATSNDSSGNVALVTNPRHIRYAFHRFRASRRRHEQRLL